MFALIFLKWQKKVEKIIKNEGKSKRNMEGAGLAQVWFAFLVVL